MKIISAVNIYFKYPKSSFDIEVKELDLYQGQIVFIIGSNGSGKSTLSKLLTGILKPEHGKVLICGKDTSSMSLGEIGKSIGYLWQKPELQLFAHTALDELIWPSEIMNPKKNSTDKEDDIKTSMELLAEFGISHLADKSSFQMSKGEKQRLALCSVLYRNVEYLILDEPTTGLDEYNIEILCDMLLKINSTHGIGMCIISHDRKFRDSLAERITTLNGGRITYDSVNKC